jgi:hypothetical protein
VLLRIGFLLRALFLQEYALDIFLLLGLVLVLTLMILYSLAVLSQEQFCETLNMTIDARWSCNAKLSSHLNKTSGQCNMSEVNIN